MVLGKKVDLLSDQAFDVFDVMRASGKKGTGTDGEARTVKGRGRRKAADTGVIDYNLINVFEQLRASTSKQKDYKAEIIRSLRDVLSMKDIKRRRMEFEKENVKRNRPSHYVFGASKCQFMYNDLQMYSSKKRTELLGRMRDYALKKSEILADSQIPLLSDEYVESVDTFTLPGAVDIPDNRNLALVFGVPELEYELNMESNKSTKPTPYGPFKDPLSGRQVVAPPKWFLEQEITRVQSRLSNNSPRQQFGRCSTETVGTRHSTEMELNRLSDARQRTKDIMTFIERRNKASTLLTEAVVQAIQTENGKCGGLFDDDDGMYGGAAGMDGSSIGPAPPVRRSELRQQKKQEEWIEDFKTDPLGHMLLDEESMSTWKHRPFAEIKTQLHTHEHVAMKRRAKEEKKRTKRETTLETFDYIQHNYYWRERKITLNKENDWRLEVLRVFIFKMQRQKQKARLETMRLKRAGELKRTMKEEPDETVREVTVIRPTAQPPTAKKSLGHELMEDLDELDVSMDIGGNFHDDDDEYEVLPTNEQVVPNPGCKSVPDLMKFSNIDDIDLADMVHLSNEQVVEAGLPLLRKFKQNMTTKDLVAYEMARAYKLADVDSTNLQSRVDQWQEKIEPILEEELTRKEFDIHEYGSIILGMFDKVGQLKTFSELMRGKKWYEISRFFLSCLLMANTGNVEISDEEDMNSMKVKLLTKERHHEVFERDGAM